MLDELKKAKTVNDCADMATVDCYNDEEMAGGWLACLEEVFTGIKQVKILGEEMDLKGFDLANDAVVAICKKGNKKVRITLDSIEFIKPTKVQELWLKAWLKWQRS